MTSRPRTLDPILAAASGFPAGGGAAVAPAGKGDKATPGRLVSLSELAELTGYDRDTIAAWIDKRGLPIETGGSAGVAYSISVRRINGWKPRRFLL